MQQTHARCNYPATPGYIAANVKDEPVPTDLGWFSLIKRLTATCVDGSWSAAWLLCRVCPDDVRVLARGSLHLGLRKRSVREMDSGTQRLCCWSRYWSLLDCRKEDRVCHTGRSFYANQLVFFNYRAAPLPLLYSGVVYPWSQLDLDNPTSGDGPLTA